MSSAQSEELVVRKSVTVNCSPEQAFELFTERKTEWWPYETNSEGSSASGGQKTSAALGSSSSSRLRTTPFISGRSSQTSFRKRTPKAMWRCSSCSTRLKPSLKPG